MKWISSFRAKLIFTVFPVVAAVTTAALLMAERRFSAAYRQLYEERFEDQVSTLTAAKQRRFEALSTSLQKIAAQPEVAAALEKRDLKQLDQILRPQLNNLAFERLESEAPSWRKGDFKGPPPGKRDEGRDRGGPFTKGRDWRFPPGQAPLIGLVDPLGNFLTSLPQRAGSALGMLSAEQRAYAEVRRKSGKLELLGDRKLEDILEEQEVGYLHVELPDRTGDKTLEHVREVFITPLRDPKNHTFVGAFVFGLPLTERTPNGPASRSGTPNSLSGVWVEDQLVTNTIPADKREELSALLNERLGHSNKSHREITMPIDGVRYLVFFRVLNPGSPFQLAAQVNLYSLGRLDDEISELRQNVVGLGIVALLGALGAVLLISRTLSRPVGELAAATRQIEKGNFEVRVPVRNRDELGALASSFNQMVSGLALQEKYRSVLNAVADRTVAQQLIERTGRLGGELRHVSMLFCDIRGFTAMTENMPPAEIIELLNEHMTALTDVSYEYGGIVDKFVGDLIMVLFGAPTSTGSDAARAVQCAQAMMQVRRELNETSRHSLEMGIGIATGNVVAGCMGSDQRLSYTVLGHSVNLASRLCSIAQPGEIVMDDETYAQAHSLIQAEPMSPIQLKGISEPVQPWRTLA